MRSSGGILLYRKRDGVIEVLLAHMGGPIWGKKDNGAWSIPKGETNEGEDIFAAAQREFTEETGLVAQGNFIKLGSVVSASGKHIHVWAVVGDCNYATLTSNTFTMEWPPHSGQQQEFPENDRYGFFTLIAAREKIQPSQIPFLERLEKTMDG